MRTTWKVDNRAGYSKIVECWGGENINEFQPQEMWEMLDSVGLARRQTWGFRRGYRSLAAMEKMAPD